MEKYLIFEDGISKKFWYVRVEENKVIITFGRIGTAGQTQEKAHPTLADAEKDAAKQAAGKLKKGYVETTPPENAPKSVPADSGSVMNAVKAAAPVPKSASKAGNGPADVADDGKLKPWHGDNFWVYYYSGDESSFSHLKEVRDEPLWGDDEDKTETKPATASVVPEISDEEIEFDEDDDEDDRRKKREKVRLAKMTPQQRLNEWRERELQNLTRRNGLTEYTDAKVDKGVRDWLLYMIGDRAEWTHSYRECDSYMEVLRLLIPDEETFRTEMAKALAEGVEGVIDTYGSLKTNEREHLKWMLENGATFDGKEKVVRVDMLKAFIAAYKKNPDPARFYEIYDEEKALLVARLAPEYAEGVRETVRGFLAGEYNEGVWPVDATHFELKSGGIKPFKGKFWKRFSDSVGLSDKEFSAEMMKLLPALLQKMAADGDFDGLKERGFSILVVKSEQGDIYLRHVLDAEAQNSHKALYEQLIASLEGLTSSLECPDEFKNTEDALKQSVEALMEGVHMPVDLPRARALMQKFLYSCNQEAQNAANDLYCHYDDYYPVLQHDRALWLHRNGNFPQAINVMGWAADKGYAPAAERLAEFQADRKRRTANMAKYKSGGAVATQKTKVGRDNFRQIFSDNDLLIDTDCVLARAYVDGHIMIRFRIEGEQAYSETLDWLCNLLEKDYADLNDGYQIAVRFLIKPTFIKALTSARHEDDYGFAKTSCHAFFARAVEYPSLREKVKRYAELALRLYDWYTDLDGEENCVPGTFAACALAFAEEKYVPMIGLFGRNSDDEHQYIQLLVAGPLFKQYGATPEVAAALYDIQSSNGQEGDIRLNKALLTTPVCLRSVMDHVASGQTGIWEAHHLEYHVPGYVEAIWSDDVRANLKKFKQFADGAATPEERNTFIDFYNFYKEYATLRDKADYGEDLTGVAEATKNIVVPVYDTDPLLPVAEADKMGWKYDEDNGYAEKRAVVFYPSLVDDPGLLDFILDQWDAGSTAYKAGARMTFCNWDSAPDESASAYGKWVFHIGYLAHDWGVMLTDGKNKPFVLYGILNVSPLAIRWCKRPFKTAEEAEAARLSSLIRELPPPAPRPSTDTECALENKLTRALTAILNEHWWMISQLTDTFKPEQGRYYDAARLLRAKVAIAMEEPDDAAAIYDELSCRRPEFANVLARKRSELGKAAK